MRLIKLNRRKRTVIRRLDENGKRKITLVVMYDDLSKAKKPPAWMKELLFGDETAMAG